MSVLRRKPPPLFSTHSEMLRSQQDCGERKIFIDSEDKRRLSEMPLCCPNSSWHCDARRIHSPIWKCCFSETASLCTYTLKSRSKSRQTKRIIISKDQTTKSLTAHTGRGKTLGVAWLEINDMIIYTVCNLFGELASSQRGRQ